MPLNLTLAAKNLAAETLRENLIKAPKFLTEYMVYFDAKNAEGPYNDVYLYSFIKHRVITPDTLIAEKGKKSTLRAGDCKDLEDFFRIFSTEYEKDMSADIQESTEEMGSHNNIPKKLRSLYLDNKDLFEECDGADEVLEHIHELSIDSDRLNKDKDGMFFSTDDLEGYLREDLSDRQNAIVENMVKETYRFLLHTKWDADLPAELIDLAVDVAQLFDDPYTHIDRRILKNTYEIKEHKDIDTSDIAGTFSVDDYADMLLEYVVDGVEPNKKQRNIIQEIAQIQFNLQKS